VLTGPSAPLSANSSLRTRSLQNRLSQEWAASTTHLRFFGERPRPRFFRLTQAVSHFLNHDLRGLPVVAFIGVVQMFKAFLERIGRLRVS
jgi:hypothetical protein